LTTIWGQTAGDHVGPVIASEVLMRAPVFVTVKLYGRTTAT